MLNEAEIKDLKKYSVSKSDLLLQVVETVNGNFGIRPVRWSAGYSKGRLSEGRCLAIVESKEEAIDALVAYCGYTRKFAEYLCRRLSN